MSEINNMPLATNHKFEIDARDLIIQTGIASKGKNVGKPYAFAKLNYNLANSKSFIGLMQDKGATVLEAKTADTENYTEAE